MAFGAYGWMLGVGTGLNIHPGTSQSEDKKNIDDLTSSIAGSYILMAASGIIAPYFLTKNTDVPYSAATLYGGTAMLGLAHGALLALALDPNFQEANRLNEGVGIRNAIKNTFLAAVGVSVLESVLAINMPKRTK